MKLINASSIEIYTYVKQMGDYHLVLNSNGEERHVHDTYFKNYYKEYTDELWQELSVFRHKTKGDE